MAARKQTITLGIALAVAILGTLTVWITVPLWVIAVLLFAWGNLDARRNLSGVCRSAAVTSSRHWLNWTRCSPAGVERSPQRPAGFLLKRPVGRHQTKFDDTTPTSAIRAGSWNKLCRIVAKVEWHPGELYPRVGFIMTNMSRPT